MRLIQHGLEFLISALAVSAINMAAWAQGISAQDVLSGIYHPCTHCRQIACANIVKDAYNTRTWLPGLVNFGSGALRMSKDSNCYGCWLPQPPGKDGIRIGMCLIVPKEMWRP